MRLCSKIILLFLIISLTAAQFNPHADEPQHEDEHDDHQHEESQHEQIPGAGLSILFIFGGLLYSGILKAMCDRVNIPINPILLITGIFLGKYYQHLGYIGKATQLISSLNPNGILAIFLPTLVFQSAFKSQWHMLKKQFGQTLILGVPCVILASCFIMLGIKLLIGYQDDVYSWKQAFLLACTLSCTDIFSFISKLRQYGTPQMLISLIQGESLFNYCTFVLIFQITNEVMVGTVQRTFFDIIALVFTQTLGGIISGLLFGFIALFFLKRISYNGVLVVTIMIIFCYTIYMLMEFTGIKISGIIALVTYGIFMGAFGKAHLVGEASVAMQSFWSYAVFIAETSIFLIAGVQVGYYEFRNQQMMDKIHFISLIQIYLIVMVSRYLAILIFQSRLSNLGYGMKWRESLVIAYGGLKGAIGISFAMIVFENQKYSALTRNFFLIHVSANSLFTLLINGMTTGLVINLLKLSTLTKIQYKFFKQYIQQLRQKIQQRKHDMMGQKFLNTVDWNQINQKIGLNQLNKLQMQIQNIIQKNNFKNTSRLQKQQMYFLQKSLKQFTNRNNQADNMAQKLYEQQNIKTQVTLQIRKRFIKNLKYKYWVYHEQHNTMPDAVMLLLQSANVDLDIDTQSIESWVWIKNQITYNIRFVSQLRKVYFIGNLARDYQFSYIFYCYDVVSSYIQANQQARKQFKQIKFKGINQQAVKLILKQSEQNQKQAQEYLYNQLTPSFPQIQQQVVTRKASFNLLLSFRNIIDTYNESGQLEISQYEMLSNLIDRKKMTLQLQNPVWAKRSLKLSLKEDKVFGLLPDKILTVLQEKLVIFESYSSKQIIQTEGSPAKYLVFIRRGACTIQLKNGNLTYKLPQVVGEYYGWQALLSNNNRSIVTTNTLMTTVSVRKHYVEKIMDFFPEFQQAFWKQNMYKLLKMYTCQKEITQIIILLQEQQIIQILEGFKLRRVAQGEFHVQEDCIILRGSCSYASVNYEQQQVAHKVQPLTFFEASQNVVLNVLQKTSFLVGKFPNFPQDDARFTSNSRLRIVRAKRSMQNTVTEQKMVDDA